MDEQHERERIADRLLRREKAEQCVRLGQA
jgi:hypothetical protein